MNSAVSHGVRQAFKQRLQTTSRLETISFRSNGPTTAPRWVCIDCRVSNQRARVLPATNKFEEVTQQRRWLTTTRIRHEEPRPSPQGGPINSPPDPALPSTTDSRRSALTKRLTHLTDTLLARASVAGQHINVYTGTDYTAISTIRDQITAQEALVRTHHASVSTARTTHSAAHAQQAGAQKEIVGLLERKASWTPTDLERYMALVRSEHVNEQAVQAAKEGLAVAERELEESRALLERLERKQYHEEQIWSDTIRRNSTWVTFGLMGVNIVLLLANIAIFEPWRRRKIVRDVERVVREEAASGGTTPALDFVEIGDSVGEAREDASVTADASAVQTAAQEAATLKSVDPAPNTTTDVLLHEAPEIPSQPSPSSVSEPPKSPETWTVLWESYVESFQDLFSERIVQLKKVDVTTTALQGAATGVAAMGLLFVVFRPR